jgi:hypothetical protein
MRFDGYNRHDFNFPRTSREAFGTEFYVPKSKSIMSIFLNYLVYFLVIFCLFILIFGC